MNLYDAPEDVVRKSIVGLGISPDLLAKEAGLESRDLMSFLNGRFSQDVARRVAPVLGLDGDALCGLPDYQPETPEIPEIKRVSLPFEDEEVNIWLIESADTILVIDCGLGSRDLTNALKAAGNRSAHLLVTHAHRDHIGGLTAGAKAMLKTLHAPCGFGGCSEISAAETLELGPFEVHAVDLSGHHPQALGYRISGPRVDAIAVGDAVFAGSMGGCANKDAFTLARKTIEEAFSEVSRDTIILPGHGPATTLGNELKSNPFLAAWFG